MRWLAGRVSNFAPSLLPAQVRALIDVGIFLRWVAIAFAALAGYVVPRVPRYLTAEILVALVYNGIVMAAAKRAPDEALPRIALTTTVIDQVFCLAFIALYNVTPGSHQVAAYIPAMIEAVGFYGVLGAAISAAFFFAGLMAAQLSSAMLWRIAFDGTGTFSATMIVVLIAACLAGVSHALASSAGSLPASSIRTGMPEAGNGPEMSAREHEVLQLLALGYSNATIASRLGVSERSIKACVEKLLARLKAHNRAEAVAAAARLELL